VSDTAGLASVASAFKPPDFGALEPAAGDGSAFEAIIASLGYDSVQTSEQLETRRAASIGRNPGENGNIVPLPYLNQLSQLRIGTAPAALSQHVTVAQMAAHSRGAIPTNGVSDGILDADNSQGPLSVRKPLTPELKFASSLAESRLAGRPESVLLANELSVVQGPASGEALIPIAPAAPPAAPGAGIVMSAISPVPLHHARFAEGFAQQVTLMASDGVQHARISINPPELGPVELRIVVRHDEATVQLASQHGAVRDALEEALPRLREQFEQAGMRLTDSAVFSELPSRSGQQGDPDENLSADAAVTELELADTHARSPNHVQHGFVDAYV